jgi:DNA repair protein RAD16
VNTTDLQSCRLRVPSRLRRHNGPMAPPKSSARPRGRLRGPRLQEIRDSDDLDASSINSASSSKNERFEGVVISARQPSVSQRRSRRSIMSETPSSVAGSVESSDYETPATSAVVTPTIDSGRSSRQAQTKISASARALELRTSSHALAPARTASRKRHAEAELHMDGLDYEDHDTKLARRLQAEEYGAVEEMTISNPAKRRKGSSLSPIELVDSDDEEDTLTRKRRKPRTVITMAPPSKPSFSKPKASPSMPALTRSGLKMDNTAKFLASDTSSLSALESDDGEEDYASEFTDDLSIVESDTSVAITGGGTYATLSATNASTATSNSPLRQTGRRRGQIADGGYERDPFKRRAKRERQKLERAHPEIKTIWDDLEKVQPIKPVPAEQPAGISRKLKVFQLEGLNWMIRQEKSQWKGGLLGDEMGMGKTIQAVSLIMSDFPAKDPTLVVVPPVALMQWQAEINDYTNGKLNVLIYHISANPKCRTMTTKDLKKYNVIMVSYSGLESMYRKENKGWNRNDGIVKEDSILHAIKFHRLILDEAHSIKSRTTSVAKACFALQGNYKWCLSGTPVQNRIGEFFSLLRFLNVKPFACYFCKQCKCKELHWSQNESKMCNHCNHSGFSHVSVFNQELLNPITQGDNPALRKEGLTKLRLITDRIMLRRMKRDHTSSMELPPKEVIIHNEFFGEIERDFSQSIMSNTQRKFDTYVSQGVMLNNYANIFGLIMQMRQVANHPDLILRKNAEGGQNIMVCCICDEPAEEAIRSRCRHEFCRECAKNYVRSCEGLDGSADCPRCHIPLVIDWDQPDIEQDEETVKKSSIINRIKMEDWTSSTKIEMLVYDLYKLRSKKQTHKSIVFSQFTSMLQLVQWRLQKSGFSTVLLDGSMSPAQRQKSIDYFMKNVDVEVFLVSLKAGGVALNLTEASRVFIVDP